MHWINFKVLTVEKDDYADRVVRVAIQEQDASKLLLFSLHAVAWHFRDVDAGRMRRKPRYDRRAACRG